MTVHSHQVTATTEPTLLYPPDADGVQLLIRASGAVYLGNSDLTPLTGFLLPKDSEAKLSLSPNELVYACTISGVVTVYVLATMNQ